MEQPNYLRMTFDGLVRCGEDLQRFVKETLELNRAYGDLPPDSSLAAEFAAILSERRAFMQRWYDELKAQWDRLDAFTSEILADQTARWQESLDADLAELWKSRPTDE